MTLSIQQSNLNTVQRRPVAVDLFAGAGGFSLGMEQAGFDVLAAVEYDPIHACTHAYNFPLTEVICADIATVTSDMILDAVKRSWEKHDLEGVGSRGQGGQGGDGRQGEISSPLSSPTPCSLLPTPSPWDGKIDLVFGGSPCQGFSLMGKRNFKDERNSLIFHFYRLVKELRPRYFVMENVPGMIAGEHKQLLEQLEYQFKDAGYEVRSRILNAADFSVPQKRRRLFVIGMLQEGVGKNIIDILFPTSNKKFLTTVKDAIGDLPDADTFGELASNDEVLLIPEQLEALNQKSTPYINFLRSTSFSATLFSNFSYSRWWNPQLLTSSMQTQHQESSKIRFASTLPGQLEPTSRFRRLDYNGLSHTLRAGTDKTRGRHTSPRPIHPELARVITVREAARLHSFPDWFRFHQTKWHGFRQVGNAVPPLLARAIGEKVITALGVTPTVPQTIISLGDTNLLRFTPSEAKNYWS
jgi:DNA (cytosine-5)-methyltransferase 1